MSIDELKELYFELQNLHREFLLSTGGSTKAKRREELDNRDYIVAKVQKILEQNAEFSELLNESPSYFYSDNHFFTDTHFGKDMGDLLRRSNEKYSFDGLTRN